MTHDQRLRLTYPHVADLPERPDGWGQEYDDVHDWLVKHLGSPLSGRWYLLAVTYFRDGADCTAFSDAWCAAIRTVPASDD